MTTISERLAIAARFKNQYILKDKGQPRAALLSLDDLELLKKAKADKERAWDDLFENLKQVHAFKPQYLRGTGS